MRKNYFDNEQARINNAFYSANGFADDNFFGDNNFYGNAAGNMSVASAPKPKKSNPFTFSVANSASTAISTVYLLGANQNTILGTTNFNNNAAVTITMLNASVTYAQFLQALKSSSFSIGLIHVSSSNTTQPFNTLTVSQSELNGDTSSRIIAPVLNPDQNQNTVSVTEIDMPVNAFTQISFQLEASATAVFRLFPAEIIDVSQSLVGQSATRQLNNPNITGFRLKQ